MYPEGAVPHPPYGQTGGPVWPVGAEPPQSIGLPAAVVARMQWDAGEPERAMAALRENGLWDAFSALARRLPQSAAGLRQAFDCVATLEREQAARTGDALCPGVDIEKFKAANRVPMFPNQWQVWKLYRTDRDNPSPEDVRLTARAVVVQWFKTLEAGVVDHIEATVSPKAWLQARPAGTQMTRVKRREDNPSPMSVHATKPIAVWVSFVYRGSSVDGPWPVHKAQILNPWCPVDADWMLDEVWKPEKYQPIPEASAVPELIRPEVEEAAKKAKEFLGDFGTTFGGWLAVVALLGVTVAAATFGRAVGGRG